VRSSALSFPDALAAATERAPAAERSLDRSLGRGADRGAADSPERSAVVRLSLTDFRCYDRLRLDADPRPAVLVGPNGAGKTNLLEALSFFVPGRGLRRARMSDVSRRGAPAAGASGLRWAAAATFSTPTGPVEIGTGFEAAAEDEEGGRRLVRVDGAPARSQSVLGEMFAAIWLLPEMDRLFVEGASERRRFVDRLVAAFDPSHGTRLNDYEQAMRERTRLLRDDRNGLRSADGKWIGALERRMAESGVALAAARRAFVQRLAAACELGVGPFPAASVTLTGDVETWLDGASALQAEDRLCEALAASRAADREAGRALVGPHRADIEVVHLQKGLPAALCSTGEQKAVLISIVLAHARLVALDRGTAPLLLLDEIAAHLDAERRAALFDEICAIGAQAWMTGTDLTLFEAFGGRAQYFRVESAGVRALPLFR
jgi:DNA replication and repair protein RecF